jgi:hypothetical protein
MPGEHELARCGIIDIERSWEWPKSDSTGIGQVSAQVLRPVPPQPSMISHRIQHGRHSLRNRVQFFAGKLRVRFARPVMGKDIYILCTELSESRGRIVESALNTRFIIH